MSGRPQIATAETLAKKASDDARVVETLAPHDDIGDGPIGFWAQQAVEKSIKVGLALRGVDFPMMEHDLDFLSGLCAESNLELPDELTEVGWLTLWVTTYENAEDPPEALDRDSAVAVSKAAVDWSRALVGEVSARSSGTVFAWRRRIRTQRGFPPDRLMETRSGYSDCGETRNAR